GAGDAAGGGAATGAGAGGGGRGAGGGGRGAGGGTLATVDADALPGLPLRSGGGVGADAGSHGAGASSLMRSITDMRSTSSTGRASNPAPWRLSIDISSALARCVSARMRTG